MNAQRSRQSRSTANVHVHCYCDIKNYILVYTGWPKK